MVASVESLMLGQLDEGSVTLSTEDKDDLVGALMCTSVDAWSTCSIHMRSGCWLLGHFQVLQCAFKLLLIQLLQGPWASFGYWVHIGLKCK
ncbi:hypothetical protein V6N13_064825 [Hibiscus sabdariffa]